MSSRSVHLAPPFLGAETSTPKQTYRSFQNWQKWVLQWSAHITWDGPNIITYDPRRAFFFGVIWIILNAFKPKHIIAITAVLGSAVGLAFLGCESGRKPPICVPFPSQPTSITVATAVGFLVVIFLNNTLNRWWSERVHIGNVMGRSSNLTILTTSLIKGSPAAPRARSEIVRLLNAAHFLIYKEVRKEPDLDDIVERGLLTEVERDVLQPLGSRFNYVYGWIVAILEECYSQGLVKTPDALSLLINDVTFIRGNAADLFMYLNCPLPFHVFVLVAFVTTMYLFQVYLVAIGLISKGMNGTDTNGYIITGIITLITNFGVYGGIFKLHEMMVQPFGDDAIDFPSNRYMNSVLQNTTTLLQTLEVYRPDSHWLEAAAIKVDTPESAASGRTFIDVDNGSEGSQGAVYKLKV